MKKRMLCAVLALLLSGTTAFFANADSLILINENLAPMTQAQTLEMVAEVTDAYFQDQDIINELQGELAFTETLDPFGEDEDEAITMGTMTHQGMAMRFLMDRIGEADDSGRYPLYITLHGGGEGAPEGNDSEWYMMYHYYRMAVKNGIYIACRGITDTWDLHFQPQSYPLYDRLIQAMICLYGADPDRVYLLGFSAGGDGVYQIAPRMADRFAAANMSSGHPNGVSLLNLANCPFSIQVGVRDYYSEDALRCIRGAEFEQVLTDLHNRFNGGYEHQVLVHVPEGHNYDDSSSPDPEKGFDGGMSEVLADPTAYADSAIVESMMGDFLEVLESKVGYDDVGTLSYFPGDADADFDNAIRDVVKEDYGLETVFVNACAVDYVSGFKRNPAPDTVIWDLSTRAVKRNVTSFYWLKADASVTSGIIVARYTGDNTVEIEAENVNGDFSILVNPALLDVSRPIRIKTGDGLYAVQVNPSRETLLSSVRETGDPGLAWVAEIPYSLLRAGSTD